ncbi:PorP/SprF family type IX secretion system membrane protein [Spongiivirga citrea]|uniref:Type IX secretion system membrane protein PorP/SprF n=1 Tax=Spongiivirga citrea TaxID=1481457 RepID=A0A6M0CHQ0_9FLAO|nr:type IX secretion system membrane protein PorP/SprF [Spongiivirga citrea]NER17478.1 type IX secretion system membrane protein PorP/SprF [Spongiivirga citrea]
MNRITRIYLLFLVLCSCKLSGQQDPHFTLYKYNMNIVNPAYVGSTGYTELNTGFRSQWVGVIGGPETQSFSLSTPISNDVGLGLSVVHDNVFVLDETHLYADFSYKLKLSESSNLFLGLKAGGSFLNIDLVKIGINDDPLFNQNVSRFNPNIGIGAYLLGEKYFVTISAPGLLSNDRYEREGFFPVSASDRLHIFTGAGYTFTLTENIDFNPSFMIKTVAGSPISYDLTGLFSFYKKFEIGASYRNEESISAATFFRAAKWLKIGYSYEYTITDIATYNSGTHEVLLRFNLDNKY